MVQVSAEMRKQWQFMAKNNACPGRAGRGRDVQA